ncbi:MAG: hypothetical protein A2Z12_09745 [Actinobacteria bacterium RBG_16_68_21]|nr:MAG: hypothetical protein A2Z12_09745 [Actinobacteria bacterium RBG_16_68_21]
MRRLIPLFVLLLGACNSAAPTPTTAPPGPTTTTTIVGDTCERLAQDAADYLEVVVQVLNETPTDVFTDRSQWPEALVALTQQGTDLDARSDAMRCDPADMQAAVFALADIDPKSPLARYLAELLGLG